MFLLVDDRDGRVVAELEDPQEALDLLEGHAMDDPDAPDYLCIVVFQDHAGAMLATESSVTIRSLPRE